MLNCFNVIFVCLFFFVHVIKARKLINHLNFICLVYCVNVPTISFSEGTEWKQWYLGSGFVRFKTGFWLVHSCWHGFMQTPLGGVNPLAQVDTPWCGFDADPSGGVNPRDSSWHPWCGKSIKLLPPDVIF